MPRFTEHAAARWVERFPGMNMLETYAKANEKTGAKTRKMVAKSCRVHDWQWTVNYKGKYLRMTKDKIVFVVAPPETIITVLDFRGT